MASFEGVHLLIAAASQLHGGKRLARRTVDYRPVRCKDGPWQGQSQVPSALFQVTVQPLCVQVAETAWSDPSTSRHTAIFSSPLRITPPSPRGMSSARPTIDWLSPF